MTTPELITAILVFVLAGIFALLSALQFAEKGFLFNNAYLWASKEERRKLDRKPYYRQSAIVFCLISAVFLVIGLSVVLRTERLLLPELLLLAGTLIYAVVSSVRIEARKKK